MKSLILAVLAGVGLALGALSATAGEFANAWHSKNSSIVLDAYEYTPIDWTKMKNNRRLAGFINKASDGLSPKSSCGRNALCRVTWRRYAATKELYHTRKVLAKTLGMKWGAYHLARPGNPRKQAEHFLNFANPDKDDLIALDIEHNDPKRWMSLPDAEIFAKHIKARTGRYPVLYTNHSTAKFIAQHRAKLPLLSKLNLWYARYKTYMRGAFPMGHWKSYTLWQFSSMVNCNDRSCPWRINGAGNWIDVNVVAMSPEKLRKEWPFAKLRANDTPEKPNLVLATTRAIDTTVTGSVASLSKAPPVKHATSLEITFPSPLMAMGNSVATPKWRPGATIVRWVPHRTSDQIFAQVGSKRAAPPVTTHFLPAAPVKMVEPQISLLKSDLPGAI